MTSESTHEAGTRRAIATRLEFEEALREAFDEMAAAGCREAWWLDEDFASWPLNERAVVETLTRWCAPHRRLTVIARGYDEVVRRHPRWVEWRRQWSHVVECRAADETFAAPVPALLLAADRVAVHLADPGRHRGALTREPADLLRHRECVDAVLQRSVESFGASVLGL
ncbi:MAG TPA: hypothetical protein VFZ93_03060 [Albitalea sp.]